VVYVLNAGSKTIAGFRLSPGRLGPIPHSVQPLGAGALVPKQIQFTNDGQVLAVTENGSNTIDTFVVGPNQKAGPAITTPSTGGGPFGFDFDRAGHLLVSDAGLSTGRSGATSYDVAPDGTVTANGPAVPIDQAAAAGWPPPAATPRTRAAATSAATASPPTAPSPPSAPRRSRTTRRRPRTKRASAPTRTTCTSWPRACRRSSATRSAPTGRSPR
jgi:hypothetical protein